MAALLHACADVEVIHALQYGDDIRPANGVHLIVFWFECILLEDDHQPTALKRPRTNLGPPRPSPAASGSCRSGTKPNFVRMRPGLTAPAPHNLATTF